MTFPTDAATITVRKFFGIAAIFSSPILKLYRFVFELRERTPSNL
jgi:hypothetical protein